MELVLKIFETLDITPLAVLQMGITVVLAFILSATLVRPVLRIFEERENRSTKPMEESRSLLAQAEEKSREYEEALRKATAESLARKRAKIETAARDERKKIEAAIEESNRKVEEMKVQIAAEQAAASKTLRDEVSRLSAGIAEKVLGRSLA
ncbi:MAG: ATP synthase F0 subunit B [Deltaproteobacteria bacterium]